MRLIEEIKAVFDSMEMDYRSVAEHYAFTCEGCPDNCCSQRFHHHTHAEYHYLLEGLRLADPELARQILVKARIVVESYAHEAASGTQLRLMCPVNFDGRCELYMHRPMICRMHGLPHRFRMPDGREQRGGGCAIFSERVAKVDWTVNRTPHYSALARIESELRKGTLARGKYAKTTAQMIMDMLAEDEDLQALIAE